MICMITPPPLLRNFTDEDLTKLIQTGIRLQPDFESFPIHTQAVEHCVKLVAEASQKVCGADARDDLIRTLSRIIKNLGFQFFFVLLIS